MSTTVETTSSHKGLKIFLIVFVVILILAVIGTVTYVYWPKKKKPSSSSSVPSNSSSVPSKPSSNTPKYVWLQDADLQYKNGESFSGAKKYCTDNNARIATYDEIQKAYDDSQFEACYAGWYEHNGNPESGFWIATPDANCPTKGPNKEDIDPSSKRAAYCYGEKVPQTNIKTYKPV